MKKKYQIIADQNMPGIELLFGDFSQIKRVEGRSICPSVVASADAILCRSITSINQSLLANSTVQFVGTATIGTDHLDLNWLKSRGIGWANAAGCNAAAVAQYVLSGVSYWLKYSHFELKNLKVGIIGAGNVGRELARCLNHLNIEYLLCDPPLKYQGDSRAMISFDEIIERCNVITLHVPLENEGDYPTKHLFGKSELQRLRPEQLLINASRGAVIDNEALLNYLNLPEHSEVILDVFENEPEVPQALLDGCLLATPHIAGHTFEGKMRGSWLIYKAFCDYFRVDRKVNEQALYPAKNIITLEARQLEDKLLAVYDIRSDARSFQTASNERVPVKFDRLRKDATQMLNGRVRRDYSGWHFMGEKLF